MILLYFAKFSVGLRHTWIYKPADAPFNIKHINKMTHGWVWLFPVFIENAFVIKIIITQGGHRPGKHGKPGKLREFEKLSKSQGKLREI